MVPVVLASLLGGGAMAYWASTNVYQTYEIGQENAQRLAWERERFYTQRQDEIQSQLDEFAHDTEMQQQIQDQYELEFQREMQQQQIGYQQDLTKIGIVESFDRTSRQFEAGQQTQRLTYQASEIAAQQQQAAYERDMYLKQKAYESITGNKFKTLIGDVDLKDLFKITHIIDELEKMLPRNDFYPTPYLQEEDYAY